MSKYPLSATGRKRLSECHPDLIMVINSATFYQDITVCCGHRNKEDQNRALAEKKSQVPWPKSRHNSMPSMAVDIAPYSSELGGIDWNDLPAFALLVGRILQIADELLEQGLITHKVVSGLDWDQDFRTADHSFLDAPHLELVEVR